MSEGQGREAEAGTARDGRREILVVLSLTVVVLMVVVGTDLHIQKIP